MTVMKDDYRNHRSAWTLRELSIVESCYGKEPTTGIARRLGRTAVAVRQKAVALGLGLCGPSIHWSRQEEEVLRNEYARGEGISHVMTRLPGRTKKTIYQKARMPGITSGRGWTQEECRILAENYPSKGMSMGELPDRTPEAIKTKVSPLGVRFTGDDPSGSRPWIEVEKSLLEENLGRYITELYPLFPDRSPRAIQYARGRMIKRCRS